MPGTPPPFPLPRAEKPKPVSWRAVALILAVSAIAGVLCWTLYQREVADLARRLGERETGRAEQFAFFLHSELQSTVDNLQILATGDGLQAYLSSNLPGDLDRAARRAVFFSQLHPEYDQIRYIDERGQEIMRVNRRGQVTPINQLENKADRPFFQQALALNRNDIHISAFDLNEENGRVEEPLKPVVRISTPMVDAAGRKRGIYVINVLGEHLLTRTQQSAQQLGVRLRLLNAAGYWIKAEDPAQEWGFRLPDRAGFTLARTDPELWTRLERASQGQVHGQARRAGGMFSWQRLQPFTLRQGETGRIVTEDAFLIVASEVSAEEWQALLASLNRIFFLVTPGLMLLAGGSIWFVDGRRRAARALRRSEENLAVTLHSIGDAVLATDTAGRITRMNPIAENLTGWTEAEAQGRPIAEVFNIINEETRKPGVIPVQQVLATGEIQGLANHTVLIARDGRERPIADSAAPIRDRDGHVLGVVLVFRDVTEEHAAQRALRESEVRYRTLFSSIDEGFCVIEVIFDRHGKPADLRFLEINPSFAKQTGLVNAQGRLVSEIAPELEDYWFEIYGRVAKTGESARFQNRAEPLNRTFDVFAFRFGDAKQRQVAVLFNDITRRLEAEGEIIKLNETLERRVQERTEELARAGEAVRNSEHRFRALIEHGGDSIALIDANNRILYLSPAVTNVEGYAPEELIGRSGIEHTHPDDLPLVDAVVKQLVARPGQPIPVLWRRRHKDGRWLWLEGVATNLLHDPAVGAIVTNYRDVTARKQAEAEVRQLNADLEARVRRRTSDLEVANKELESFSYSVSHDLRAPLRHIQGYVAMLARETQSLSEKGQRYLKTIADAGREMGTLIDNLLDFSRMSRTEMREGVVDPAALIQEVRTGLELATRGRNIVWRITLLPRVRGDAAMLRQVFANLLGNAVKYTRKREVAEIEIGCDGEENGRTIFYVKDNGAGFDMEYAGKLFGVFQRMHRADEFEGTGIGLANVQRIVARHGGRIWADAKLDQGATFYFTLAPVENRPPMV